MPAGSPPSPALPDTGSLDFSVRLMEHLVVPTFVLDAGCRVIIWNLACERLTGIPAREVIGTRDHWRGFYLEERPCLADLVAQGRLDEIQDFYADFDHISEGVVAHGRTAENWCVMPRSGKKRYLAIDAGPIYDDTGRLIAVVETLRDITAQKLAQEELQRLTICDGLTGVMNRRGFDERLETEWRRAGRDSVMLSLLMVDVDYFKRYNDTYGHQSGDKCLRRIAQIMEEMLKRAGDVLARYGGEEFSVLLPATGPEGALAIAEELRAAVEALGLPHAGSDVAPHVTVSIGVASTWISDGNTSASLVAAADSALYEAKRAGRNRTAITAV